MTVTADATVDQTGCVVGGAGGEYDFTGAPRSTSKCTPGPLDGLLAGTAKTVSLLPASAAETPPHGWY
eukprot:SAG22_NODE_744_length_7501_cov_2.644826_3_plen_68_part_00